jgi:flagellar basal-body rod protein FlgB
MINTPLFPYVERMIDATAQRQQTISANIANIDTPGFKAQDVSFVQEMDSVRMLTTASDHIALSTDSDFTRTFEVQSEVKENGNSVSLDREMTELNKNGMQYIILVQYLNSKLKTLRSSMQDGGR